MRATRLVSQSRIWLGARKPRLRLVDFLVRMCDLNACPALNLPEAILRNRLAAARLVLIFGICHSVVVFVTGPGGDLLSRFPSMPLPACCGRCSGVSIIAPRWWHAPTSFWG